MNPTAPTFRLTRRTDEPEYRMWCTILFSAGAISAALTFSLAETAWPSIIVAVFCTILAVAVLIRILRPVEWELVITDQHLCWGVVGGAQTRIYRDELQQISFASDSAWDCALTRKSALSEAGLPLSVPGEIIGQDAALIATELQKRWPEADVVLRGELLRWKRSGGDGAA